MNVKPGPLADLFHGFAQSIALSESERMKLSSHADEVVAEIAKLLPVGEVLVTGSIARSTAVRRYSDIDAMVVLRRLVSSQSEPMQIIVPLLGGMRGTWSSVRVSENAVRISFIDGLCVDVLLAFRSAEKGAGSPIYKIPSSDLTVWQLYAPGELDERVKGLSRTLGGSFQDLIRILKWWNGINGRPVASYELETLACDLFEKGMPPIEVAVAQAFGEVARTAKSGSRREALGGAAELMAREAIAKANQGSMVESVESWRCLLGDQFPDIAS